MTHYLRIFLLFVRNEAQFEMAYRANLAAETLQMLSALATSIGAVLVLFAYTNVLNGWTLPEMLVLLGVYYLIHGTIEAVFQPSFSEMMEQVRLGTLDFTLLKPANSQFLVSARRFSLVQIAQILLGFVVMAVGLGRLGQAITAINALGFLVVLGCGLALVYSILLILATTSFWFVKVDNIMVLFWAFTDAGRFPVDIYPGWLRLTLTTVVPIGLAVTVPAEAISGRLPTVTLVATVLGTIFVFCLASWFWRRGLKSYTGASA